MPREIPRWRDWFISAVTLALIFFTLTAAHAQVTFSWASVGNPGNAADTTGYGAVAYAYEISKYDVTNTQYVQFLNTVDPTGANSLGLYTTGQTTNPVYGVALNSASTDGSKYSAQAGKGNQPVVFVSWNDAARFVNWLSNGQGSGGTETGVYDMSQADPTRAPGATFVIPSIDEWYKAAFYDPTLSAGAGGYWQYATRHNTLPIADIPPGGTNSANYDGPAGFALTQSTTQDPNQDYLTDVGAYLNSTSYYGTFDQTGDVFQWNETLFPAGKVGGPRRGDLGGSWNDLFYADLSSAGFDSQLPLASDGYMGFRVAFVPEPASAAIFLMLGTCALMRRKAKI